MRSVSKLSIVIPCYNEQEILNTTHDRLTKVLQSLVGLSKCSSYEIIYVNDGSTDATEEVLRNIFLNDAHVRVVTLRRNFGLQGALSAGLNFAQGDAVVTIDADLQDPPEKIEEMIVWYEKGYDLILGVREDRQIDSPFKKCTADLFYILMRFLGVEIIAHHGEFRLMARALVNEFNALSERGRFIRSTVLSLESRYAKVFYKREQRCLGTTKFTYFKMFCFSMDAIFSNTFVPLRLISIIGGLFLLTGCVVAGVLFLRMDVAPLLGNSVLLFVFSGINMLSLGIIGEYVARLYVEAVRKPVFIVREELKRI